MFCGFDLFCLCFLFSWLCLRFHSSSTLNWVSYNWLDVVPQNQKRSNPNSISCSASRFCVSFITFISLFILFVNVTFQSLSAFSVSVSSFHVLLVHPWISFRYPLSPETKGMYVRLVSDSLPKQETLHYLLGTSEPKDETSQEKIYWMGQQDVRHHQYKEIPACSLGGTFFTNPNAHFSIIIFL